MDVSRLGIPRNVRKREGNCRAATNVRQFQRRRGHRASRNARFSANFNQRHQPRSFRRKRHERTLVKSNEVSWTISRGKTAEPAISNSVRKYLLGTGQKSRQYVSVSSNFLYCVILIIIYN